MRPLFLLAGVCLLAAWLTPAAGAKAAVQCPFEDKAQVVVKGIARSIQSGAQEPGESINTYFYLETSEPPCGRQRIFVFAPGIIPCLEGENATVSGVYYAPAEVPFDQPMIDTAKVICSLPR